MAHATERERIDVADAVAHRAHPDTAEEIEDVRRLSIASIDEEPWERWWE